MPFPLINNLLRYVSKMLKVCVFYIQVSHSLLHRNAL